MFGTQLQWPIVSKPGLYAHKRTTPFTPECLVKSRGLPQNHVSWNLSWYDQEDRHWFYAIFQRLLISANTQAAKFQNSNIKKQSIILNANIQFSKHQTWVGEFWSLFIGVWDLSPTKLVPEFFNRGTSGTSLGWYCDLEFSKANETLLPHKKTFP